MTAPEMLRRRLARYELIAEIASGGMGVVLLARTGGAGGFQRLFAVKIMHPHLVEDAQFVSMLLDEARVAARIHHPNVVPTVDISQHANLHFLVMDYVEGFQLGEILSHPGFSTSDRLRVANRILLDAMSGLEAAHNLQSDDGSTLGIVHRDVSPQNILVGVDGVGRLTDFGIAFALSRITASRPGIIKGKPAYMAPEQALGSSVDRRADIWALGVMLWETMTGKRLFVADTDVGTILKVISDPIPAPRSIVPELPAELEAVCLRALARDPAQRYATAREMAAELGRAASHSNLLLDAHAMPDLVQNAFGPAIAARRAEIRQHIAELGSDTAQMSASDVYQLPRLSDSLARARPSPMMSPPPATPEAVSPAVVSKSPVPAAAPVPRSTARIDSNPGRARPSRDETPLSSSRKNSERKPMRQGGMLLIALLLAVGGGILFFAGRQSTDGLRSSASSMPPAAAAAAVPTLPAPTTPPREEALAASAPLVTPASASIRELPPAPPVAPAAPPRFVPAMPTPAGRPGSVAPGAAPAPPAPQATRPADPVAKTPSAEPATRAVPIEENPYRLR